MVLKVIGALVVASLIAIGVVWALKNIRLRKDADNSSNKG